MPLVNTCFTFVIMFLYCEFGEMVTNQFNELNERFSKCNWYLLPIEMQRMFVIVMANTQRPAMIQGYANVVCTRESFKQVRKLISDISSISGN